MLTAPGFVKKRKKGEPIKVITAYDYSFARLVQGSGAIDAILVGDSLGMVIQGHNSTLPVTVDDVIYHCSAVRRGAPDLHVIGDMPFMSYQLSPQQALDNAGRLVKEAGVDSVKLEGGVRSAPAIERIVTAGIPVMGHVGLTPQSVNLFGGHKMQGKTSDAAARVMQDAIAVEEAGAFALVLEGIPADLAREITGKLQIPTIGIGAGPHTSGQVLVIYDLLGMDEGFNPRFLKKYANLSELVQTALQEYAKDVDDGVFPGPEHSVYVKD
jgi:3-methyl-2-oxobutanoate hydroxymethyltransferase